MWLDAVPGRAGSPELITRPHRRSLAACPPTNTSDFPILVSARTRGLRRHPLGFRPSSPPDHAPASDQPHRGQLHPPRRRAPLARGSNDLGRAPVAPPAAGRRPLPFRSPSSRSYDTEPASARWAAAAPAQPVRKWRPGEREPGSEISGLRWHGEAGAVLQQWRVHGAEPARGRGVSGEPAASFGERWPALTRPGRRWSFQLARSSPRTISAHEICDQSSFRARFSQASRRRLGHRAAAWNHRLGGGAIPS